MLLLDDSLITVGGAGETLLAGDYTFVATDNDGCSIETTFVEEPDELVLTVLAQISSAEPEALVNTQDYNIVYLWYCANEDSLSSGLACHRHRCQWLRRHIWLAFSWWNHFVAGWALEGPGSCG